MPFFTLSLKCFSLILTQTKEPSKQTVTKNPRRLKKKLYVPTSFFEQSATYSVHAFCTYIYDNYFLFSSESIKNEQITGEGEK